MKALRKFLSRVLPFGGESWAAWRAVLAGAFGLPLDADERAVFGRLTNRAPPASPCRELWVLAGRRAGKDSMAAAVALFLALCLRWRLSLGEVGVVMILAADRDQAKVAFRYVRGLLESRPELEREIDSVTADTIRLANGIEVQVGTSDHAAVRGRTIVAAILDEVCFWDADAGEVLRALRPAMATQPAAMLIAISSVYSQRGPAFETYRRHYGSADPQVLVVKARTRDLNPLITEEFIAAEMERDPEGARAEYLSEFRSDLEAFLDAALVDRATRSEPRERPRVKHLLNGTPIIYQSALDVSGGRGDATAAAVAHRDGDAIVIDACRRWPAPHDPIRVAAEVREFFAGYGLAASIADQYGAELTRVIYQEAGVALAAAEITRSEAYLAVLPLFTGCRLEIPDDPRLRQELLGLERRTGRSGKDAVDHRPGSHDDLANAVALCAWRCARVVAQGADALMTTPSEVAAPRAGSQAGRPRPEDARVWDSSDDSRAPPGADVCGFLTDDLPSPWR